jgi:chemotaxis protein MotB
MRPIEVGPHLGYGGYDPAQTIDIPFPRYVEEPEPAKDNVNAGILEGGTEELTQIAGEIRSSFPDLLEKELINLGEDDNWLEIEINTSLLFQSGDATPNPKAVALITKLAEPLKKSTFPVNVEGFTDDVPIKNDRFPSNWELSAARAAAIVRILVDTGMKAQRFAAIGYGEFKPIASNTSEAGRQRNRRVVLLLSKPTNRFEQKDGQLTLKPGSPDGALLPVRLPGGGLLFTADPPVGAVPEQNLPSQ